MTGLYSHSCKQIFKVIFKTKKFFSRQPEYTHFTPKVATFPSGSDYPVVLSERDYNFKTLISFNQHVLQFSWVSQGTNLAVENPLSFPKYLKSNLLVHYVPSRKIFKESSQHQPNLEKTQNNSFTNPRWERSNLGVGRIIAFSTCI